MGYGIQFECEKCGKAYRIKLGVGMGFPNVYRRTIEDVKEGVYGEQWKKIATETAYAAVDATKEIYICSSCGHWKEELNLSLYRPNDPEKIRTKQYGIKNVEEWGYVPYVMYSDLKYNYKLIKVFSHKCDRCGKRMRRAKKAELHNLPCPYCETVNYSNRILMID